MGKLKLVQIQTTTVCNARCIFCPYKDSVYINQNKRMTDELFKGIIEKIKEYHPEFDGIISPYLCNEPFADPKLLDKVEYIYNELPKAQVEISTNAELLNSNKIDRLVELMKYNKSKIVISHHGIDETSLETNMGISWNKSIKNIIELIRKADGKIPIAIQDMAYSKDKKYRVIQPIKIERYWNNILDSNNLNKNNIRLSTLQFHNRAGNVELEGWDYDQIVRQIDKDHPFNCYRLHNCLHILANGDVIACCMDYNNETIIGELRDCSIEDFYNGDKYKEFVDKMTGKIDSEDNFICKRCMSPGG